MTLREWDLLEEAVTALDGSWGAPENLSGGGKIVLCKLPPIPRLSLLTVKPESYLHR